MTPRLPHRAYRAIGRLSRTRFLQRVHPALYHRFHGAAFLGSSLGCRMILLHTTGARTGLPRTVALFAFPAEVGTAEPGAPARLTSGSEDPPALVVIASNGGAGHPPAWHANLRMHPAVLVEEGSRTWVARAREAAGIERSRLWRSVNDAYPGYDQYQAATPHPIPVVVLDAVDHG